MSSSECATQFRDNKIALLWRCVSLERLDCLFERAVLEVPVLVEIGAHEVREVRETGRGHRGNAVRMKYPGGEASRRKTMRTPRASRCSSVSTTTPVAHPTKWSNARCADVPAPHMPISSRQASNASAIARSAVAISGNDDA